jgi:hypothetical protein
LGTSSHALSSFAPLRLGYGLRIMSIRGCHHAQTLHKKEIARRDAKAQRRREAEEKRTGNIEPCSFFLCASSSLREVPSSLRELLLIEKKSFPAARQSATRKGLAQRRTSSHALSSLFLLREPLFVDIILRPHLRLFASRSQRRGCLRMRRASSYRPPAGTFSCRIFLSQRVSTSFRGHTRFDIMVSSTLKRIRPLPGQGDDPITRQCCGILQRRLNIFLLNAISLSNRLVRCTLRKVVEDHGHHDARAFDAHPSGTDVGVGRS